MKINPVSVATERGAVILVVLAVLFLLVALSAANQKTLRNLERELQLVERRQNRIHAQMMARTNQVSAETNFLIHTTWLASPSSENQSPDPGSSDIESAAGR